VPVTSYHFLVGPLMAFAALGVILLLCRWVFAAPKPAPRPPETAAGSGDYGLLVPIATVRTPDDAQLLRSVLDEAGIRCTVIPSSAAGTDGADVLVFRSDASRARELVGR
jgi:hypothetical protein